MITANTDAGAPQAYLNYLVFDQNLQLVPTGSGMVQVPMGGTGPGGGLDWTTITPGLLDGDLVRIEMPGYIIVYINNNSIGKDVYFDNIKIEHYTGTVLDDNHYYPFGLTLSSTVTASTAPAQPYKYNTKELEKSFGLEMYDYGARMQDPQLGIWHQVDPLADKFVYESPYVYAGNNPVRNIDVGGKFKFKFDAGLYSAKEQRTITNATNALYCYLEENPALINIIHNSTGLSPEIILEHFTPGQGPTVNFDMRDVSETTYEDVAHSDQLGMSRQDADLLIDGLKNGNEAMIFAYISTIFHEYGHYGDRVFNDFYGTGSFIKYDDGTSTPYSKVFPGAMLKDKGKQNYHLSINGHRGSDIPNAFFGGENYGNPQKPLNIINTEGYKKNEGFKELFNERRKKAVIDVSNLVY